ncbi:hypothetical protein C8Q80DRAFT_748625 [Daedaleopsis nitida]|nr:hypothetical protein C8Q80DRAFT_748625 [Daedaleopsis nitida]
MFAGNLDSCPRRRSGPPLEKRAKVTVTILRVLTSLSVLRGFCDGILDDFRVGNECTTVNDHRGGECTVYEAGECAFAPFYSHHQSSDLPSYSASAVLKGETALGLQRTSSTQKPSHQSDMMNAEYKRTRRDADSACLHSGQVAGSESAMLLLTPSRIGDLAMCLARAKAQRSRFSKRTGWPIVMREPAEVSMRMANSAGFINPTPAGSVWPSVARGGLVIVILIIFFQRS